MIAHDYPRILTPLVDGTLRYGWQIPFIRNGKLVGSLVGPRTYFKRDSAYRAAKRAWDKLGLVNWGDWPEGC